MNCAQHDCDFFIRLEKIQGFDIIPLLVRLTCSQAYHPLLMGELTPYRLANFAKTAIEATIPDNVSAQ